MAEYRLIDFGDGRKLESIGSVVMDRPSPAAAGISRRLPSRWQEANASFYRDAGERSENWRFRSPWPELLQVDCGGFSMPVAPTPFGHIGLFPEQAPNWSWIHQFGIRLRKCRIEGPIRVLNLFAYTGASSLAAASVVRSAGAAEDGATTLACEVTHVDAAKPNVEAAKRAAEQNGFEGIRFIVDDARKFVAREIRRQRRYDLVILDPPAYGHGGKGNAWRLERDLWPLLEECLALLDDKCGGMLLTGHSADCGPGEVRSWFRDGAAQAALSKSKESSLSMKKRLKFDSGRSVLRDQADRELDAGFFMRIEWGLDQ
jgi:23S rRNA (cytosine1962-C5)-methyltransferase